jgi:hypothetical protein
MRTGRLRALGLAVMTLAIAATPARAQQADALRPGAQGARDERQPEWTARPPFGETEVYVLPKGATALVFGLRPTTPPTGATTTETAYRAEFGLPARFQLGLHATGRTTGRDGAIGSIDAQALEVRWAFTDWGTAWGNPAILVEWREASRGPDVGTVRLLFGGGFGGGWRWGSDLGWTQAASGPRDVEQAWATGVSYAASRFASIGAETRLALVDRRGAEAGTLLPRRWELLAGPSLQVRPFRRIHVDLTWLLGTSQASPRSRATLSAGWEF